MRRASGKEHQVAEAQRIRQRGRGAVALHRPRAAHLLGQGSLRVGADGLTARTTLHRRHWDWNDVEHFRAYTMRTGHSSTRHVGFDRRHLTPQRQGLWRTLNRGMSGVDETLRC